MKAGRKVSVGKLGIFFLQEGFYVYTGSAFGPGGLKSRVGRHLQRVKTSRWHIDYIVNKMIPLQVWYNTGRKKRECEWSDMVARMGGECLIPGFGSSDCNCFSHLFYFQAIPGFDEFKAIAGIEVRRECVVPERADSRRVTRSLAALGK